MTPTERHDASYRDHDAFIFVYENIIYRQINQNYAVHYDRLITSDLYEKLTRRGLLIEHEEVTNVKHETANWFKTIKPQQIGFISYPYEWCFSQLKDGALLTLEIMLQSLEHGMILKDATPFNVQFIQGKPVFIDTCSFECYEDGKPWIAYRQFCESFLSPLLLMKYKDVELNKLMQIYLNGIPLSLASKLLPFKSYFSVGSLLHVHFQSGYLSKQNSAQTQTSIAKNRLVALVHSLISCINQLRPHQQKTSWQNYYTQTVLSNEYVKEKESIINLFLNEITVADAIDLGSNTGHFAALLASKQINTVACDIDPNCVEQLYVQEKKSGRSFIHPLLQDLAIPSPSIGWGNTERTSFLKRKKFDLALALALIHHLAIGRNIPLPQIAQTFSALSQYLIVEFIPKTDPKVQLLLSNRKDIFDNYNQDSFEQAFSSFYIITKKQPIPLTGRILYLLKKKGDA